MQLGTLQNEKEQNDGRVGSRNLGMNKLADELKLTGEQIYSNNESFMTFGFESEFI